MEGVLCAAAVFAAVVKALFRHLQVVVGKVGPEEAFDLAFGGGV